jgi:deoxyadenosine/deoxycytidine kinase
MKTSNTLILVNGFGGAGKSTIGKILLEEISPSAFIDFDWLIEVRPWEYNEPLFNLGLRNAAALIRNYFECGHTNVILASGCGKQHHLDFLLSQLLPQPKIFWFFLETSREELKRRRVIRNRDGADAIDQFDFLEEKIGQYEGKVKASNLSAFEIRTDSRTARELALDIKRIIEEDG